MLLAPREIELRDEPIPQPQAGGIVVRVRAALTDGTDLKTYRRGHPHMPMPTRFGHEFSGDIAAMGKNVSTFAVGDAVMCVHTAPCGSCFWCNNGQEELCESVMATMILGAYADYIEVPEHIVGRNCFLKPAGLSYCEAAFLEPVACVVHSVGALGELRLATVAVVGDGGFGLLHAMVLRAGGGRAILVGRRAERLALAGSLGIETLDARSGDIRERLRERSDGRGVDAVVECTGNPEVWEAAPSFVRRGGTVSFFGGLPSETRVSFSAMRLHYDEVRLISPFHFTPRAVARAYEMICAGAIDVKPLISHSYRLDDVATAFARLDAGEGLKALIEP